VDQEGERERTTVEVSKVQLASKPGLDLGFGMSLGDGLFTAQVVSGM
jgi:hypothetical protein